MSRGASHHRLRLGWRGGFCFVGRRRGERTRAAASADVSNSGAAGVGDLAITITTGTAGVGDLFVGRRRVSFCGADSRRSGRRRQG